MRDPEQRASLGEVVLLLPLVMIAGALDSRRLAAIALTAGFGAALAQTPAPALRVDLDAASNHVVSRKRVTICR